MQYQVELRLRCFITVEADSPELAEDEVLQIHESEMLFDLDQVEVVSIEEQPQIAAAAAESE